MSDFRSQAISVDLIDDGVLWLINTTVFHPRGFALAYDPNTKEFTLMGDGDELWRYGHKDDVPGGIDLDAKFKATHEMFTRAWASNGRGRYPVEEVSDGPTD